MDIHIKVDEIDEAEVMAVHYDEKPNKDRQRCGIHDIKKEHLCLIHVV